MSDSEHDDEARRGHADGRAPADAPRSRDASPGPGKMTRTAAIGPAGLVQVPGGAGPGKGTLTQGLLYAGRAPGHGAPASAAPMPSAPPASAAAPAVAPSPPVAMANLDAQSIGETYAQGLSAEALEEQIAYLTQRRDRVDLPPLDRELARENLAVLAAEAARRGQPSTTLQRETVRAQIEQVATGLRELSDVVRQLAAPRRDLRGGSITAPFLAETVAQLGWITDATSAAAQYLSLAANEQGVDGGGVLAMASVRAQAARAALGVLREWCVLLAFHEQVSAASVLSLEYSVQMLARAQPSVRAALAPLAGFDPDAVAQGLLAAPAHLAALAQALDAAVVEAEHAQATQRRVMQIVAVVDFATMVVGLRAGFRSFRPPPGAVTMPAMVAAGGGAAAAGQVAISAEVLAQIRHLIEIGAITAAGAAELLRGRGFNAAMAQATDLPQSVKDLLGEGPTTDGMRTRKVGEARSEERQEQRAAEGRETTSLEGADLEPNIAPSERRTALAKHIPPPGNAFIEWFDSLSLSEFDRLLADKGVKGVRGAREVIAENIRHPGSKHEWLMVAEARQFKKWGVSMRTILAGRTFTEATIGRSFRHGGAGSGTFHKALRAVIRSSNGYEEFLAKLNQWADRELVPSHSARWPSDAPRGRYSLPDNLQVRSH